VKEGINEESELVKEGYVIYQRERKREEYRTEM
jgi:hypothetical protein